MHDRRSLWVYQEGQLLFVGTPLTGLLDFRPFLLELQPLFPGCHCSLCAEAALWFLQGLLEQVVEACKSILSILILRAVASRFEDQNTIGSHSPAGQTLKAQLDIGRQACRSTYAEAELGSSGHFVDILSAWPRAADKVERQLGMAKPEKLLKIGQGNA